MKFSWGTGIFLFIILFVTACAFFLVYASRQEWNLVEKDYYPKSLKHDEKMNKIRNTGELDVRIGVKLDGDSLFILYPSPGQGDDIEGSLLVYRPSDDKLDLRFDIRPDMRNMQIIPLSRFSRGRYLLQFDWNMGGKGYYQEEAVYIP